MILDRSTSLSTGKLQILSAMAIARTGAGATTAETVRALAERDIEYTVAKASTVRSRLEASGLLKPNTGIDRRGGPEIYTVTPDGRKALLDKAAELEAQLRLVEEALSALEGGTYE